MKYVSFEELPVWKEAIHLAKIIYELTVKNYSNKDYSLCDQIRRSAVSVSSNIAEGFERDSTNELIRFLLISKGSLGELKSQMYLSYEIKKINKIELNEIVAKISALANQIGGFVKYLKDRRSKV